VICQPLKVAIQNINVMCYLKLIHRDDFMMLEILMFLVSIIFYS